MTKVQTVLKEVAPCFNASFVKERSSYLLKQQRIYQNLNSGVSFLPEDWEGLAWHIREVEHLNNLNREKSRLKARLLRKQARINRFSLASLELTLLCLRSQQKALNPLLHIAEKKEVRVLLSSTETQLNRGRDLNHFYYSGPQWMKRFRRDQCGINESILSILESLSLLLELYSEALVKKSYALDVRESREHLNWHLEKNKELILANKGKATLVRRLFRKQWQVNQYNVIIFDKLFEILKQHQEQVIKILSK